MRNAIIPVVALAAVWFGFMLGGSIVIETIFNLKGIGWLSYDALLRSDLPVVQAIVLIFASFYVGLTSLADLLNAYLDPRDFGSMSDMSLSPFRGQQTAEILEPSPLSKLRRRIFKNHSFLIGAVILILILLCALLARLCWRPMTPMTRIWRGGTINPFGMIRKLDEAFLLGTDKIGRDYLSRLIYGAQISLLIGFSTILISGVIGTALGVTAGYFGGRVDMVVNFIINTPLGHAGVLGGDGGGGRIRPRCMWSSWSLACSCGTLRGCYAQHHDAGRGFGLCEGGAPMAAPRRISSSARFSPMCCPR